MAAEELIGIKLNLEGYEGVMKDLRTLDAYVKAHRRTELEFSLNKAREEVLKYRGEINKLNDEIRESGKRLDEYRSKANSLRDSYRSGETAEKEFKAGIKETAEEIRKETKSIEENYNALKDAKSSYKQASQAVSELNYALSQTRKQLSFGQMFNKMTSNVAHFGSALQSAGNAITRLTSPFRQLTSGIILGAGFKLLNKFTEGLESSFSRTDTMRKYVRLMEEYSKQSYTAQDSINQLDQSVQGLPIALDDAVSLAQRFTLSVGDMKRGTDIAIATNNAFLASMATDTQRYQGMLQMQDLLNGKDLTSREWMSLGASMGKAINEIGKEFGYTNKNMGEFRQALYSGDIKTKDFLDALVKVGTGNGSLVDLAKQSLDTWEAFFSRIGTAMSRMGYGVLTALNELTEVATNGKFKSLNMFLDDMLIPTIDNMTQSIKDWIKAHPDEIINFFKAFKDVNWGSLLKGVVEGFVEIGKAIGTLAEMVSGKDLSNLGRWLVKGNLLGSALTIFGGLIKGTRHIWGFLLAGAWKALSEKGGLIGKIMEFFGGKKADKKIAEAPKAMDTLRNVVKSLEGTLTIAGQIAIPALTGLVVTKSFKEILKDLRSIGELVKDVDWGSAAKGMTGFGIFIGAFAGVGKLISKDLPAAVEALKGTAVAGAIAWFASFAASETMRQVRSGVGFFKEMTESFGEISTNLKDLDTSSMGSSAKKVGEMLSYLNSLTDTLAGTMVNGEQQGGMKLVPESVKLSVENLSAIITALGDISEKFKGYKESFVDNETIGKIGESLGLLMEQLTNAFSNYTYGFDETNTAEVKAAIENISEMLNAVIGENGLLALARQFIFETADIPGVTNPIEGSKAPLQRMFDSLAEIYRSYQNAFYDIGDTSTIVTKMSNLAEAIESIRLIFKKMRKIQGYDMERVGGMGQYKAIQMIQNLIGQLKVTFGGQEITTLQSNIQGFVDSVNSLMDSIDSLTGEHEIEASVKLKSNEVIGADKVVKTIEDAVTAIQNAWKKMPYSLSRTINISVGGRVNASGFNSAIEDVGVHVRGGRLMRSVGGYVSGKGVLYRSNGGSIFKPRGTDRIPAMLTEGEYVHRKKAVDTFGIDFMRKVNNLDVRGAVQALLARGGNVTSTLNRQSVVNNTVNDNRRVTQNINTNNPSMARMSLGRFAGAL